MASIQLTKKLWKYIIAVMKHPEQKGPFHLRSDKGPPSEEYYRRAVTLNDDPLKPYFDSPPGAPLTPEEHRLHDNRTSRETSDPLALDYTPPTKRQSSR